MFGLCVPKVIFQIANVDNCKPQPMKLGSHDDSNDQINHQLQFHTPGKNL